MRLVQQRIALAIAVASASAKKASIANEVKAGASRPEGRPFAEHKAAIAVPRCNVQHRFGKQIQEPREVTM